MQNHGLQVTRSTIDDSRCGEPQTYDVGARDQLENETDVLTEEAREPSFDDVSKQLIPRKEMRALAAVPQRLPLCEDQVILCSGLELHDVAETSIYHDNSFESDFNLKPCATEDVVAFDCQLPMVNEERTVHADYGFLQIEDEAKEDLISVDARFEKELPEATEAYPLTDMGDRATSVLEVTSPGSMPPQCQSSSDDQVIPDWEEQDSSKVSIYKHVAVTSDGSPKAACLGDSEVPCGQRTPQQAICDDTLSEGARSQRDSVQLGTDNADGESTEGDVSDEHAYSTSQASVGVQQSATPLWMLVKPDEEDYFESTDEDSEIILDDVPLDLRTTTTSLEKFSTAKETDFHMDNQSQRQRKLVEYSQDTSEEELADQYESPSQTDLDNDHAVETTEETPLQDVRDQDHESDGTSTKTYTKVMEVFFNQDSRQFLVVPATSDCVVPDATPCYPKQKQATVKVPDSADLGKFEALNEARHSSTHQAHVDTSDASFYNEEKDDLGWRTLSLL
ncbi:hypothetical protein HPB47_019978 [Ixodes persulcatus]|uniref:Uncharacterized protein n=1 Tax=Ixodes persulcatus TaxID=34615 RepID=A0AC60QHL0_IXOPE|nr:hypothetical protein HPB47_019978 [Ixodes persulcatus]